MAVLKLPRLPAGAAIVDIKNGQPVTPLTRAWNDAMGQIETNVNDIAAALAAADAAQSDADAAMAAAIAAQADADAALAAAVAAQATADALDAALNVTAGKVLTVLNTMTLSAIDGSTLNIGTGGTLGTAAFTNASDYLPSGTSLAFLPIAGGTLTGPLIVSSTISVSGHTTFEGVTSTGATGTGRIVYDLSPTLTTPNIGAATATSVKGSALTEGTTGANPYIWITNNAERARLTDTGYFKASPSGTYGFPANGIHEFVTGNDGNEILILSHNTVTSPYGMMVRFTGAAPNNASNYFFRCQDSGGAKLYIMTDSGIWNDQTKNVNFSDASMKEFITPYDEKELDGLEASFISVNWGKYKYRDRSHEDWNHGPTAQDIKRAFALSAPELVDETDPSLDKEGAPHAKRMGIYETDLSHIGMALLSRALKRIEAMESKMYAAGIT